METNPFQAVRAYLSVTPAGKWTAILSSIAASLSLIALFPLLYLYVDLLNSGGRVSTYDGLPAGQQAAFQQEWDANLKTAGAIPETLTHVRTRHASLNDEWEIRWTAATHALFSANIGVEAADIYLASPQQPLGILGPVARERRRPTGTILAVAARTLPWTWKPPSTVPYLTTLFGAALGVFLLRSFFLTLSTYYATSVASLAATRLRRALHTHSFRLPSVAIKPEAQAEAGDILSTRAEQIQEGFLVWLTAALRGPLTIASVTVVMLCVHPWLTVCLLSLGGLVWLVTGRVVARLRQEARRAARRTDARLELLREGLAVCPLVKGYMMDRFSQTRVERHLADLGRSAWRKQRGDAASRSAMWVVSGLTGTVMLYVAGRVVLGSDLTLPGLTVLVACLGTLVVALHRWLTSRARLEKAKHASAAVVEFLDRRGEAGQSIDAEFLQPLGKRLDIVEVSLREPGTGRMILEQISLNVPAGAKAALVYADADEAHALAYLIARFQDPTGGEIKVDGKNIRWVTYESLRTQVCLILEQSLTFSDTAANNIGCGDPSYSLPQIIDAAKAAHAHQFIQALPNGYETRIGAGGVSLRVGERFRIALARAILRDPSLLVIEEPAEPLDPDSLSLIDDSLERLRTGRTLLFLARRPSTVKTADRVYVLQHGRVVASGNHDDLVATSELYRLLHFKQSLTSPEPV